MGTEADKVYIPGLISIRGVILISPMLSPLADFSRSLPIFPSASRKMELSERDVLVQSMTEIVVAIPGHQPVHIYNFKSATWFLDSIHDIQRLYDHISSIPVLLQLWTAFPRPGLYNQT